MKAATVHGGGVAALTAARLLALKGWTVDLWTGRRVSAGPRLLLSDSTWSLLGALWGLDRDQYPVAHPIRYRTVLTDAAPATTTAHIGWSLQLDDLRETLALRLSDTPSGRLTVHREDPVDFHAPNGDRGWAVIAARNADRSQAPDGVTTFPSATGHVSAGSRCVRAADAPLRRSAPRDACAFEWVAAGWLFAAPLDTDRALLQLMTPGADGHDDAAALAEAVSQSRLVSALIEEPTGTNRRWESSPYLKDPWPHLRRIRIGEAAVGFDPICGDGCGHAMRTAVLAVAALDAIESGESPVDVRRHYRQRLGYAFFSHLQTCREIYATAVQSSIWADELRRMDSAESVMRDALSPEALAFRLNGLTMTR